MIKYENLHLHATEAYFDTLVLTTFRQNIINDIHLTNQKQTALKLNIAQSKLSYILHLAKLLETHYEPLQRKPQLNSSEEQLWSN